MGMGLRRRGGRRHGGRRHRRVGIGRRKRLRFGRRRRRRGGGLGMLFLCCMGGARKDISYGQDIQELQQQQMMMIQAMQAQQQQQMYGQQQQSFGQQQPYFGQHMIGQQQQQYSNFAQQPLGQQEQQQYSAAFVGTPAAQDSYPEVNNEHIKELQEEQMELLKEIMNKQAEEKDPEVLQALFDEQNMLLQQMNQLQTVGYAYPEPLPAPTAPPVVPPQSVPMES